jgi:hypothetical protein
MNFDTRWRRLTSALTLLSILVMALAGSAGSRW